MTLCSNNKNEQLFDFMINDKCAMPGVLMSTENQKHTRPNDLEIG